MLLHGASDLDQRSLKTRNSAPIPKITPKTHFGGPFNAKPIIQRALRKSHVNGATTRGGVLKLFPLGGSGGAGPLVLIWDLLLSRKLLEL